MKLRDFIICDDIRIETGNKQTLVGVYQDTIDFPGTPADSDKWPKALKLGFFARILLESKDDLGFEEISFNVRFDDAEEIELSRGKVEISKMTPSVFVISIVHGAMSFPREVRAQFFFRFYRSGQEVAKLDTPAVTVRRMVSATPPSPIA